MPTLHCDGNDGFCGAWAEDHYEMYAASVDGVKITSTKRAPGWASTEHTDLCPDHKGGDS